MMKQQISPELVLVDPELARHARAELRIPAHSIHSPRERLPTGYDIRRTAARRAATGILFLSLLGVGVIAARGLQTIIAPTASSSPTSAGLTTFSNASVENPRPQTPHDLSTLNAERELLTLLNRGALGSPLAEFMDRRGIAVVNELEVRCKRGASRVLCVIRGLRQRPVHVVAHADSDGIRVVIQP